MQWRIICAFPSLKLELLAGLRNLSGQYVTSVRRDGKLIHAVGSDFVLAANDILYLSGEFSWPDLSSKLQAPAQQPITLESSPEYSFHIPCRHP